MSGKSHDSPSLSEATQVLDESGLARARDLSGPRSRPPAHIPGYEIRRCLGDGAYGTVWLAVEENTGKLVAIKFYSHRRGLDWSLLNREVEKLAVLYTSRDIIGLLSVGWDADPPYYVMEFLENGSLANLLANAQLHPSEATRIATSVCQALVHAHASGILHCDLKPANVLLDSEFAPRLADFGQSRLSHEQNPALGTLFYMAPEQADLNAVPDPRWDVYALGALLYHMLVGSPPHRTPENEQRVRAAGSLEERLAIYRQILETGPRPTAHRHVSGVDSYLADIVDRCLATDPRKRFSTARDVLQALEDRQKVRSRRPLLALGIIGPLLLLLALVPVVVQATRNTLETATRNLAARAIESKVVTAKILALAVADDLKERRRILEEVATDVELRNLLRTLHQQPQDATVREALTTRLDELKSEVDEVLRMRKSLLDDSWYVTDVTGVQRWRDPPSGETMDKSYAWRDYFHGRGIDYDENSHPKVTPIRKPHLSVAYRSQATHQYRISLSVPIWDPDKKEVIGVLGRSLALGQLLADYSKLVEDGDAAGPVTPHHAIGIVDLRSWKLLDHPWMTTENLKDLPDEQFEKLTVPEAQRPRLKQLAEAVAKHIDTQATDRDPYYIDPISTVDGSQTRTEWLAAFWPVEETPWVAVVQERREDALGPVREIEQGIVFYAIAGLSLCGLVLGGVWYFVWRTMTEASHRPTHNGLGRNGRRGPHTTTSLSTASLSATRSQ